MFSPLRALKDMWSTSRSGTSPSSAKSTPEASLAKESSTTRTAPSATNTTPASMGSVNYPTLPNPDAQSTAVPASVDTVYMQQSPSSRDIHDDMPAVKPDPPPPGPGPTTPPQERVSPLSSSKGAGHPNAHHATVQEHHTKTHDTTPLPPSNEDNDRPKLTPKRQQDCHRKSPAPKPKRDFVSEIVYELSSEDNPLPAGYLGTFRGSRWYLPDYNACLECGLAGEHRLICGHWVKSDEPCGVNCKSAKLDHAPFICPTCRDIVQDIFTNKLTDAERAKLCGLKGKDDVFMVGCCVEYATKRAPELGVNITETVLSLLRKGYGRVCEASAGPPPVEHPPFEQVIRDIQEKQEQKERDKIARENPLIKHEKRKDINDGIANGPTASKTEGSALPRSDAAEGTQANTTVVTINKKLKKKLETHREPITPQTRGTKRPLRTFSSAYANPYHPAKRITLTTPPDLGEARFLDTRLGPLVRKRESDIGIGKVVKTGAEAYSRKKRRSALKLDAGDEEIQFDVKMPGGLGGAGVAS
ncbi:Nn.00g006170.m01.CDS01 [Neocucurbitaria sp. VM-36]